MTKIVTKFEIPFSREYRGLKELRTCFVRLIKVLFPLYVVQQGEAGCSGMPLYPVTLDAKFRNGVGSITVGGSSPPIGGWIV